MVGTKTARALRRPIEALKLNTLDDRRLSPAEDLELIGGEIVRRPMTRARRAHRRARPAGANEATAPYRYKYRLAYLEGGRARVLDGVHTGKPDHRHIDASELPYWFVSMKQLRADFFDSIETLSR